MTVERLAPGTLAPVWPQNDAGPATHADPSGGFFAGVRLYGMAGANVEDRNRQDEPFARFGAGGDVDLQAQRSEGKVRMNRSARSQLLWLVAAAGLGFASAFVFGDLLRLPRSWFLVPHLTITAVFLGAYARWSGTELRRLWTSRIGMGIAGAAIVGALLTLNVIGQPASPRKEGLALWGDLLWLGVVYGAVDGLLLSVLPVLATWRAGVRLGWTASRAGRLGTAMLGIVASALVTGSYHAGYAEFRGPAMAKAVVGNTIMTTAQLLTASPITAVGGHVVMHLAAVLHGPETTVQLPPHPEAAPAAR